MASKSTYPCFACRKAGYEVPVYLDGKDEQGRTKYLNEDGSKHIHKEHARSNHGNEILPTKESTSMKIINAKLDRIIAFLEEK